MVMVYQRTAYQIYIKSIHKAALLFVGGRYLGRSVNKLCSTEKRTMAAKEYCAVGKYTALVTVIITISNASSVSSNFLYKRV